MFWARQVWFLRSNAKEKGLLPMMQVPANKGEHRRTCCHGLRQSGGRWTQSARLSLPEPLSLHVMQPALPPPLSLRHSCVPAWRLRPAAQRRAARHCSAAGGAAHLRRRPGFLCMRSYDHESKHPRLQDYPLKSNNETGRQIELDKGVRPPPPPPSLLLTAEMHSQEYHCKMCLLASMRAHAQAFASCRL